jgi:hypothetical protein
MITISKSVCEPADVPEEFMKKIMQDSDRKNSKFPSFEIPAILHFRDNEKLEFSEIDRPLMPGQGDILVKNQTYYDFKAGNLIFYEQSKSQIEALINKYQEIMKKKNCKIIIRNPRYSSSNRNFTITNFSSKSRL